jgi:hypothetical protein
VVLHEGHGRSSGPVVEQLIHVKGRDETVVEAGQEVVAGEVNGPAGIHDPGEGLQQNGPAQLRQLVNDLVQVTWIEHWSRPPHRTYRAVTLSLKAISLSLKRKARRHRIHSYRVPTRHPGRGLLHT